MRQCLGGCPSPRDLFPSSSPSSSGTSGCIQPAVWEKVTQRGPVLTLGALTPTNTGAGTRKPQELGSHWTVQQLSLLHCRLLRIRNPQRDPPKVRGTGTCQAAATVPSRRQRWGHYRGGRWHQCEPGVVVGGTRGWAPMCLSLTRPRCCCSPYHGGARTLLPPPALTPASAPLRYPIS